MKESYAVKSPTYQIHGNALSIRKSRSVGYSAMSRFHFHDYYEIFYLVKGERIYFINDRIYTVRQGDMIIVKPNTLHRTVSSSDVQQYERILINFKPGFVESADWLNDKNILSPQNGNCLIHIPEEVQPLLEHILEQMFQECEAERIGYEDYVKACLNQMLILIRRQAVEPKHVGDSFSHPMHEKISEIASYIKQNYASDLSLIKIAEQFFISPHYLSRIFRKLTGFQFREYIMCVRVEEAQKRLRESNDSITKISQQAGFKHVSHFNTTFKKITGMTPLAYRKKY